MSDELYLRTIDYALYIVDNNATIRQVAKRFNVAKSTVHYDLKNRLKHYDRELYFKVKQILQNNFNEKHIRGGFATRRKYLQEKQMDEMNYFYC